MPVLIGQRVVRPRWRSHCPLRGYPWWRRAGVPVVVFGVPVPVVLGIVVPRRGRSRGIRRFRRLFRCPRRLRSGLRRADALLWIGHPTVRPSQHEQPADRGNKDHGQHPPTLVLAGARPRRRTATVLLFLPAAAGTLGVGLRRNLLLSRHTLLRSTSPIQYRFFAPRSRIAWRLASICLPMRQYPLQTVILSNPCPNSKSCTPLSRS
mgnify:CR=1 FL=1